MPNANLTFPLQIGAEQYANAQKIWDNAARWVYQSERHFSSFVRNTVMPFGDELIRRQHGAADAQPHEPGTFIAGDGARFNDQRKVIMDLREQISAKRVSIVDDDVIDYPYNSMEFMNCVRAITRKIDNRVGRMMVRAARVGDSADGRFPGGDAVQVGVDAATGAGDPAAIRAARQTAIPRTVVGAKAITKALMEMAEAKTNKAIPGSNQFCFVPPYVYSVLLEQDALIRLDYKAPNGNNYPNRNMGLAAGWTIVEVPEDSPTGGGFGVFPWLNYAEGAEPSGRDYDIDTRRTVGICISHPDAVELAFFGGQVRSTPPMWDENTRSYLINAATHMGADPIMHEAAGELFINLT